MTPHQQLIKHDPANGQYGDCYRTCVAIILDVHPSIVPHCWTADGQWEPMPMFDWLARCGLKMFSLSWPASEGLGITGMLELTKSVNRGAPVIFTGTSSLGCNHSVVAMSGKIVSDPSGNGIVGPMDNGEWQMEWLAVGADWGVRSADAHAALTEIVGSLNVCSDNPNVPDDFLVPVDITMGELRKARAAIAAGGAA